MYRVERIFAMLPIQNNHVSTHSAEKRNTYDIRAERLHVDVANRAAGEGPDLGFVLKCCPNLSEEKKFYNVLASFTSWNAY